MYLIGNEPGKLLVERTLKFALPISKKFETEIQDDTINLQTIDDLKEFARTVQGKERNHGINFQNICKSEKKSNLEFRIGAGTTNHESIIASINLFGGLIEVSEKLAVIQLKTQEERTPEEVKLLEIFNRLCAEKISLNEKLESLLALVIPNEDEKTIYRKRYEENYKILQNNPDLKKLFEDKIISKPISLNAIFKKTFLEQNPVNGQDFGLIFQELNEQQKTPIQNH